MSKIVRIGARIQVKQPILFKVIAIILIAEAATVKDVLLRRKKLLVLRISNNRIVILLNKIVPNKKEYIPHFKFLPVI